MIIVYILYFCSFINRFNAQRVEILMPNVSTTQQDAYMCTGYKITDEQSFITQIEPLTNMDIAHHMFAFGCEKPGSSTGKAWECSSNVCVGEKTILFAWARNAPTLKLPDNVAFKVGSETKHRYIVINIHYLNVVKNDNSGLAIQFSNTPRAYLGGIMILVTGDINIPPKTKQYHSDISCKYDGRPINVFAFRVHAHVHGDVNSAYRVRNHEWKQLAKGDPQEPQAFYPTETAFEIKSGDILLGRCVYHNDEERYVGVGPTHTDEMCNVYLMYYTDAEENLQDVCSGSSYPSLESEIPDESFIRPPKPTLNGNDNSKTPMQHHQMDGSKMSNNKNKQQQQQQQISQFKQKYNKIKPYDLKIPDLSSIYNNFDFFKPKRPLDISDDASPSSLTDEYYDEVARARSKGRYNNDNLDYDNNNQDYGDSNPFLDSDDDLDYPIDPSSASSLYSAVNSQKNLQQRRKPNTNTKVSISKYTLMKNWYDPKKINLGQVGGVAIDSVRGNVIIFHRGSQKWDYDSFNGDNVFNTRKYSVIPEDTIVVLNSNTGKFVKSWGAHMFYMPHGITVDPMGDIWVTDVARHQVIKFLYNDTTTPALIVGEKNVPGTDKLHFCKPADVAVFKNGDFFVADGYCNSRIMKFDKFGQYLMEWSSDEEGRPGHFNIPHGLALHEASSLLCVADRENYRVQCFDVNGNFMHQSVDKEFGPIYGISFAANNGTVLYAINGFAGGALQQQYEKKVILIQVTDGSIMATISVDQSEVVSPHAIAINGDASEIYIATLNPGSVVKYSYLSFTIDTFNKRKQNLTTSDVIKIDKIDGDRENFRTSMFIMAFLAIPLTLVVLVAICIRLKNSGGNIGSLLKSSKPSSNLGKWIKPGGGKDIRNGFTRLNQDSENENEPLDNNSDSDSDEISMPITKA